MYSDKTLVALGCSHTYGEYMYDYNPKTCHERSWVKKLERLGNFKDSINLAAPGGSNYRSERVLLEYLKTNARDIVVIFSITDLSRFETVNVSQWAENKSLAYNAEGAWGMYPDNPDKKKKEFLEYYYSMLTNDEVDLDIINRKVLMLHTLLRSLHIEHYFFEMLSPPRSIITTQLGFKIPMIYFSKSEVVPAIIVDRNDNQTILIDRFVPTDPNIRINTATTSPVNAIDWLKIRFSRAECGHFDHDANQALAEYLFGQINIIKGN